MGGKLGREECSLVVKVEEPLLSSSWAILLIWSVSDCSTLCAGVHIPMCVSLWRTVPVTSSPKKELGEEVHSTTIFTWCTCSSVLLSVRSFTPDRLLRNCTEIQWSIIHGGRVIAPLKLRAHWNGTETIVEWNWGYTGIKPGLHWTGTGTILEWGWNHHPYLEQGKGWSSKKDDGEEHNDESGCVQHSDQLSRAKRFPLFTEVQGKGIRNSTSQT